MEYIVRKTRMFFLIIFTYRNFLTIFADYAGIYRQPWMIVTLWDGTKYRIRSHRVTKTDFYVLNESWLYKLHTTMVNKYVRTGSTVIDIGAHIGAFTIYAGTRAAGVKVYAFEPDKDNFKMLSDNIALNDLQDRVIPTNKAVAGKAGEATLWKSVTDTGQHTFFEDRLEFEHAEHQKETIQCTTFKDIFDANHISSCDLIKIDCEGMEYDILFNAPPEYLKRVKAFSIEQHATPEHEPKDLEDFLIKQGFHIEHPKKAFAVIHATQA